MVKKILLVAGLALLLEVMIVPVLAPMFGIVHSFQLTTFAIADNIVVATIAKKVFTGSLRG